MSHVRRTENGDPVDDDQAVEVVLQAVRDIGMKVSVEESDDHEGVAVFAEDAESGQRFGAHGADRYLAATSLADRVGVDLDELFEGLGWEEPAWEARAGRTVGKKWWFLSFLVVAIVYTFFKGWLSGEGPFAPLFGK